jgi:protein translocase SecG subunit
MENIFFIIVSVLLITVVLLQKKNSGLGTMGGDTGGEDLAQTRRGADKFLHRLTILLSVLLLAGGIVFMVI